MKKALITFAVIFAILTVILYFASINKLDSQSARVLGVSETINIQGTVFCAACAIMCVINAVGAMVLSGMETKSESTVKQVQTIAKQNPSALEAEARERKILAEGGWKCPDCGALNYHYVSSCGCGKNKRDVKA